MRLLFKFSLFLTQLLIQLKVTVLQTPSTLILPPPRPQTPSTWWNTKSELFCIDLNVPGKNYTIRLMSFDIKLITMLNSSQHCYIFQVCIFSSLFSERIFFKKMYFHTPYNSFPRFLQAITGKFSHFSITSIKLSLYVYTYNFCLQFCWSRNHQHDLWKASCTTWALHLTCFSLLKIKAESLKITLSSSLISPFILDYSHKYINRL